MIEKILFFSMLLFFVLLSCETSLSDAPDLVLNVGEEVKIEEVYVLANKVKEQAEKGLSSNVDIADDEVILGGGLMYKGAELELNDKIYICTKVDQKMLEFKLK
ncbi:hypothetical protein [Aureispira anguillae]|uniref:Lipoprotein n=1 Tax=Aureispira anguillae TaxID=2864201 RepID=A0A916DUM6_9BACT|nr:hypothetical protein [Aureispira anguillae]BDS14259.1 hypothetical protein AsAng_0050380 [Aureispira anguillae]